jgi:hypothetical protein
MPTVSDNFSTRFIKLDKDISCEYICNQVQLLVQDFMKSDKNIKELLLSLDIRPVSYTVDPNVPRIPQTVLPNVLDSP